MFPKFSNWSEHITTLAPRRSGARGGGAGVSDAGAGGCDFALGDSTVLPPTKLLREEGSDGYIFRIYFSYLAGAQGRSTAI